MKVSEAFPSKYLSAPDLDGKNVRVIMQHVEMDKLGDDNKPVVYFKGKTKGLALNKTNSKAIAEAYGDEMDDWRDQEIILFPAMVDYQGKTVEAIRVRVPTAKDRAPPQRQNARQSSADIGRENSQGAAPRHQSDPALADDEIPFAPEWR